MMKVHESYLGVCLKNEQGEKCNSRSVYANGYCQRHGGTTPPAPSEYVGRAKDIWEKRMRKARNKSARIDKLLRITIGRHTS